MNFNHAANMEKMAPVLHREQPNDNFQMVWNMRIKIWCKYIYILPNNQCNIPKCIPALKNISKRRL